MPRMIIASRLEDGLVAFLNASGEWMASIADGLLIEDDAEAERQLAVAKQHEAANQVVDPYLIDVVVEDGLRRPASNREAIRAFGPTVETGRENIDAGGTAAR